MDTIIYNNRNKTPGQFDDHAQLSPRTKNLSAVAPEAVVGTIR